MTKNGQKWWKIDENLEKQIAEVHWEFLGGSKLISEEFTSFLTFLLEKIYISVYFWYYMVLFSPLEVQNMLKVTQKKQKMRSKL